MFCDDQWSKVKDKWNFQDLCTIVSIRKITADSTFIFIGHMFYHFYSLLKNDPKYALVLYRNKEKYNFDLKGAKIIKIYVQ